MGLWYRYKPAIVVHYIATCLDELGWKITFVSCRYVGVRTFINHTNDPSCGQCTYIPFRLLFSRLDFKYRQIRSRRVLKFAMTFVARGFRYDIKLDATTDTEYKNLSIIFIFRLIPTKKLVLRKESKCQQLIQEIFSSSVLPKNRFADFQYRIYLSKHH